MVWFGESPRGIQALQMVRFFVNTCNIQIGDMIFGIYIYIYMTLIYVIYIYIYIFVYIYIFDI